MDLTKKILEQQYVTKEDFNELGNKALDGDYRALEQLKIAANKYKNPDAQAILDAISESSQVIKALRVYNRVAGDGKGFYKPYDESEAIPALKLLAKKHPLIDMPMVIKILRGPYDDKKELPYIPGRADITSGGDKRAIKNMFDAYIKGKYAGSLDLLIKSGVPSPRGGFVRESNVKLTKSKLQQLIKEEMKKITKPPQKAEAWLDVVGSVLFGDVDGEGADPCLKDPAAKQLIKTQMMELKNLNPEELDYIANKSADLIESFESELIGDADELLAASGEGTGAGYEYDQQILKMAEKYKCMVKVLKTTFNKASEISATKFQAQSDRAKKNYKPGYGLIKILGGPDAGTEYYIGPDSKLTVTGPDAGTERYIDTGGRVRVRKRKIKESNTKLTKSKLEQLIKEAITNITEADIKVEHPFLDAFNKYKKEIKRKLMDPNLTSKERRFVKQNKIDFIDDIEYKMTKARAKTDAQKSAYLKKEYPNHPAYKGRVLKGVPSTLETIPVDTRGGPDRIPDTDAEIEARYKRMLDKLKKR